MTARQGPPDAVLVVRTPRWLRIVAAVLLFAPLVSAVLERSIATTQLVWLPFAGLLFTLSRNRWVIDGAGIERRFPLRKRDRVGWNDVLSVGFEHRRGGLVIGRLRLPPFEISASMTGRDELCGMVLRHAPAAALTESLKKTLASRAAAEPLSTVIPPDAPDPLAVREDATSRWRDNPFFVLGLTPECSRADVERTGQKLLALLAIESAGARRFSTPTGEVERTPDAVRLAMAELRDPERRLVHELWAQLGAERLVPLPAPAPDPMRPWTGAMRTIGWRTE
jgi:hypothetical protein